jgi:hypothetical protein
MQQSHISVFTLLATLVASCLGLLSSPGCHSLQSQRFVINQATIQNETEGTLHNVRVKHAPNGKVGATSAILPHKALNVGFDGRTMMADSCTLSWTDDRNQFYQKEIILPKNSNNDPNVMHLKYRIKNGGSVTVEIADTHN